MFHTNRRADVTYKPTGVDTARVVSGRTGKVITRPHTPLAICQRAARALGNCRVEREPDAEFLTIERLGKTRTYRLDQITRASRARLLRILHDPDWPTREMQPGGWLRVSTVSYTPTQQARTVFFDPDDELNAASIRDGADVFVKRNASSQIVKVTIDRPDRDSRGQWTDRTYAAITPASRQRLAVLVDGRFWSTRTRTNGWDAVSTR